MANVTGQALTFADMNATVPQASKFVKGAMTLIEGKYDLSDIMPFINTGGQQSVTVPRPNPDAIGSVFYRNANGQYTWTKSSFEKFTEDTAEITYAFKLDSQEQEDPSFSVIKPAQGQMDTLAESMSAELLDSMFNGNPDLQVAKGESGANYRRLAGVWYRMSKALNGIDTSYYLNSTTFNGGAAIDLTNVGSANANALVDTINLIAARINANVIASSFLMATKVQRAIRQGALLTITKDSYGRTLGDWNGIRWILPTLNVPTRREWNAADTTTWIFPYTDASGNATPTAGSGSQFGQIAFLRCNSTDGFTGFTVKGMSPRGPEKLPLPDEGVGYAMRFGHGWGTLGLRCLGGIFNIKTG